MTNTDLIRQSLLTRAGLNHVRYPDLAQLKDTEWSPHFERYMRNRLIMGAFRYGFLKDKKYINYDNIGSLISRAQKYQTDGNREHLVDIANLALIEFESESHPLRHFRSVDDGEHVVRG